MSKEAMMEPTMLLELVYQECDKSVQTTSLTIRDGQHGNNNYTLQGYFPGYDVHNRCATSIQEVR
eukprot:m.18783 g.18783  ORF g.18783 m.18783 type:complete len:65 (+) comp10855_c0_seq3:416-610(+)